MKNHDQVTVPDGKKAKKPKKPEKKVTLDSIARQYMELRRLRQLISEAEAWQDNR
jgi:hypothetical protein